MKSTLSALILFLSLSLSSQEFRGTIVYAVRASGEEEASKLFNDSQSELTEVTWSDKGFEQREPSGWNRGKTFYIYGESNAFHCRESEQTIVKTAVQDFAKTDPQVKKLMPHLFSYELKSLGQSATIAGYECQRYEVVKSGFLKQGATAHVWIAKGLKLPPSQYQFESDWRRILAILPLQYGFTEGAVLRATTYEQSFNGKGMVEVTYEVDEVRPGYFPTGFLTIPQGYKDGE